MPQCLFMHGPRCDGEAMSLGHRHRPKFGCFDLVAWISHNRRMAKDYEGLCSTGEAFIHASMPRLMVRRLAYA